MFAFEFFGWGALQCRNSVGEVVFFFLRECVRDTRHVRICTRGRIKRDVVIIHNAVCCVVGRGHLVSACDELADTERCVAQACSLATKFPVSSITLLPTFCVLLCVWLHV